jgi:hypothetical protein
MNIEIIGGLIIVQNVFKWTFFENKYSTKVLICIVSQSKNWKVGGSNPLKICMGIRVSFENNTFLIFF